MRKVICSGSSVSPSASRLFGLRRTRRIKSANSRRMISLPSDLVVQPVVGQVMLVEEMAERAVPHVVQQGGQPHQRLDVAAAGHVGADLAQALVERRHGPAGQVHRPQHVLEPRVFGRGKDPPGGLQLVNLPQPLEPGVVDDLLLGDLALRQPHRRGEGDVAVDRIVAEALALEVSHDADHAGWGAGNLHFLTNGEGSPITLRMSSPRRPWCATRLFADQGRQSSPLVGGRIGRSQVRARSLRASR